MANKKFSSKIVQRWDVNFATTPITAGSYITLPGALPANCIITDGWAVITSTEIRDADDSDDQNLSIGYNGAATAFYPATAITAMNLGVYLKLIPGVINIVAAEAIATIDTPAEAVAIARASGDTFSGIALSAEKHIILTDSAGQDIDEGTMSIFIEYLKF
jgi:hypothetical protein